MKTNIQKASYPELTKTFLYSVPTIFVLVPALLLGIQQATKNNESSNENEMKSNMPLTVRASREAHLEVPYVGIEAQRQDIHSFSTLFQYRLFLLGIVLIAIRFWKGIGSITNLSQEVPWGLWIGFDVVTGVAFAGGHMSSPSWFIS